MARTFWYNATVPLVLSNSCPYFSLSLSLSLSLWLFFSPGAFVDTFRLRLPSASILSSLFSPSCILNFFPIAILLSVCFGKNEFPGLPDFSNYFPLFRSPCSSLNCCARLCSALLGTKPIVRYIPLASLCHFPCLPSYLSPTCLLTLSPLSCFFPGLQRLGWKGKHFSSFLFFLTCSSSLSQCFFNSLLISVILSGCFWDPRFSLSPMCSPLCPYWANFLLLAVSV